MTTTVWRAHVLHLTGSPSLGEASDALVSIADAAVKVDAAGKIVACGPWDDDDVAGARVIDRRGSFILPGFVDTHVHYPQTHAVDAWDGGSLLSWLDKHVFPAEARLRDTDYAARCARDLLDGMTRSGTTCALVFGSQFPDAQDALFEEIERTGFRAIVGRTTMVTGPDPLTTSAEDAVRLCRQEIDRWHPAPEAIDDALIHTALIPRFALSLTPEALTLLEDLWRDVAPRGVRFTTHLSENDAPGGEIQQVRERFGVEHYLDVYDGTVSGSKTSGGFLGPRSVFAHAVHCHDDEFGRLAAAGSSIAHCPISQQFLGSGTMPLRRARDAGVGIGLGSDVAAGDTLAMAEVANAAFKVHNSATPPHTLHPAELLHLATVGGAAALGLGHRIGTLDAGKEADLIVVDPGFHPPLAARLRQLEGSSSEELLFALLMGMGRDTVATTVVRGRPVWTDPRLTP